MALAIIILELKDVHRDDARIIGSYKIRIMGNVLESAGRNNW